MAMSLNRVQLIGNLTRDPEMRQIPGGQTVTSFSIATNFTWTDKSGQKQEKAEFHNIVAWGKLAEICGQYLKRGGKIFAEGRLQTRDWEGDDGKKRYRTEIVLENMIMLDRKGAPLGDAPRAMAEPAKDEAPAMEEVPKASKKKEKVAAGKAEAEEEIEIEDLPF